MNELALFAGAGGGILGGKLLGWKTVCAVEIEKYPRSILLQRQNDGILDPFPIWDDIKTFDGNPWSGAVDVVTGGFPCQDISSAGKGRGLAGERSGLWGEMARVIGEVRPPYAFVENSPMLTGRGIDKILMDLAEMGYHAVWGVFGADDAGAPHRRKRIWILAYSSQSGTGDNSGETAPDRGRGAGRHESAFRQGNGEDGPNRTDSASGLEEVAYSQHHGLPVCEEPESIGPRGNEATGECGAEQPAGSAGSAGGFADLAYTDKAVGSRLSRGTAETYPSDIGGGEYGSGWWGTDPAEDGVEPELGRMAHGVANRVDRLKSIGNGQVPAVVVIAWYSLTRLIKK